MKMQDNCFICGGEQSASDLSVTDTSSASSSSTELKEKRESMSHLNAYVKSKLKEICANILGSEWSTFAEQVDIVQIHGGLTNYLYSCSLPECCSVKFVCNAAYQTTVPRKVLIRIYGEVLRRNVDSMVLDSVIFALLSEKKLGPRLHGVFDGGRIEEFIESRVLATEELSQPIISEMLGTQLAVLHKLDMPLTKSPMFLFTSLSKYVAELTALLHTVQPLEADQIAIREIKKVMREFNIVKEAEWLKSVFTSHQDIFPVVFCHNDLQENNILLIDDSSSAIGYRLLPIDFEYCGYGFRAFDIGNHFNEWSLGNDSSNEHGFAYHPERYPTVDQQKHFWRAYLKSAGIDVPQTETPSFWQPLLTETAYGAAFSSFYWAVWSLIQHHLSAIEFGFLPYAITRLQIYCRQKAEMPTL